MYIQWCVKGIAGTDSPASPALTKSDAFKLVSSGTGIISNWWRGKKVIAPHEVAIIMTDYNLDRHLHDYANYGQKSPFISLACGCTERDRLRQSNNIHSAIDTALQFATDFWKHPGALFYCWTTVGLNPAVKIASVAEAVRDLNVYRRWSPYQLEGEVTAKVQIPANQISRVEWWDGAQHKFQPIDTYINPDFVDPTPITKLREFF